jgi:hypothetical protein
MQIYQALKTQHRGDHEQSRALDLRRCNP